VFIGLAALSLALGVSACGDGAASGAEAKAQAAAHAKAKATKKKVGKKDAKSKKSAKGKSSKKKSAKKSASPSASSKKVPKLASRVFLATDLGDQRVVKGSSVKVTFGEGRITVEPGCATLEGTATWNAESLSITGDGLHATPKPCSKALEQQDVWVQALLEAKPTFTLKGGTMEITDGFSSMTLTEQT
jgi:heat shock protein HslJ